MTYNVMILVLMYIWVIAWWLDLQLHVQSVPTFVSPLKLGVQITFMAMFYCVLDTRL